MADATRPISRRLRFEILRRDGQTCRYCGAQAPDVKLTVDHVIPVALGGGDDPTNLVTACQQCNAGKSSTSPDEHMVADVDAAALLFAKAIERVAEQRRADVRATLNLIDWFNELWLTWGWEDSKGERHTVQRDIGWQDSIARFVELGLIDEDFAYLVPVAMRGKARNDEKWKYFCGCCWREIGNRQELARQLIEDGKV